MKKRLPFWTFLAIILLIPLTNQAQCNNVWDGGSIGHDESRCGSYDPDPIVNLQYPSGGYGQIEYMWLKLKDPYNPSPNDVIPGATGPSYDPPMISEGWYFVRCSRRAGCSDWDGETWVYKGISTGPNLNVGVTNPTCSGGNDGSAKLNVYGNSPVQSISWSNGASGNTVTGLSAGTYSVTVTTMDGCSSTKSFNVIAPNPISAIINVTSPICGGTSNGSIHISSYGGKYPHFYILNGQYGGSHRTGLSPGTYTVIVRDANGCEYTETVTIQQPDDLVLNLYTSDAPCSPFDTATAIVSGGNPPYNFVWSNGANTSSINGSLAGTYTVTVSDSKGCMKTASTSFSEVTTPIAEIDCCQDTAICQGGTAEITVSLSGGGPWTLVWNDGPIQHTANVTQSPFTIQTSPIDYTRIELVSVQNSCGFGQVCGSATVTGNDCSPNACLRGCFNSQVNSITNVNGCTQISLTVNCTGCPTALSNLTINVPCGKVTAFSNSLGYQMYTTNKPDPNTGLQGLKIDNISGFCSELGTSMTVNYTICADSATCNNLPDCGPLLAYKAGNCVWYDEAVDPQPSSIRSKRILVECWPNPFVEHSTLKIRTWEDGDGEITIYDLAGSRKVKSWHTGHVTQGTHEFTWDGQSDEGYEMQKGIYLVQFKVGDAVGFAKLLKTE